jgi:hypothetical protein
MKALALLLLIGSFLGGSYLAVLAPREVAWAYMVPALIAGMIGLWLHRKAQHRELRSDHRLAGNIETLGRSLDRIRDNLNGICRRGDALPVYEARFEIDRLFRDDLSDFVEARESMIHVFGMQDYADVMSNFAAGERYINRVWSASTDGYADEVRTYLERARDQFEEAHRHFMELQDRHGSAVSGQPG